MKIATYNIWNNEEMEKRYQQIQDEIQAANADIIGLQEVTVSFYENYILKCTEYEYCEFRPYQGEDEGLAILSKHPIEECTFLNSMKEYDYSAALNVVIQVDGKRFSITNVHLPWDSIKARENQIIAIDRFVHEQSEFADSFILLGDFNCGINASVHRFLEGEQTLYGNEANPCWLEISSIFAGLHGLPLLPTLDCINNPRWKGKNAMYAPENFDRIYILDDWSEYAFNDVQVFGTEVSPISGLCASDHYGVVADIGFME